MSDPVAPLARGLLTSAIYTHLAPLLLEDDVLIGRGTAPTAGGWADGQPGTSDFIGYTVLKTGRAGLAEPDPFGRNRMSWKCNYQLSSSGGNESHADDVGDRVRVAVVTFPETITLRGVLWNVQKVDLSEIGATQSSTQVDPPFWSVTDAVSFWLSRSRAS